MNKKSNKNFLKFGSFNHLWHYFSLLGYAMEMANVAIIAKMVLFSDCRSIYFCKSHLRIY